MAVRIVAVSTALMILGNPDLILTRVEMNVNLESAVSKILIYRLKLYIFHMDAYHLYIGMDAEPPMINMRPVCATSYSMSPICCAITSALNQIHSEVQN